MDDYIELHLPNDLSAQERFRELIHDVVIAKAAFEERVDGEDDMVLVTLRIPKSLHSLLKTLSMNYTKKNGRKLGLYAFMQAGLKKFALDQLATTPVPVTPEDQPSKKDLWNLKKRKPPKLKRFSP